MGIFSKNSDIKIKIKRDIEPQEILFDRLSQKKEKELGGEIETPLPVLKFLIIGVIFLALFLGLFAKTFQFQILDGAEFLAMAKANKERFTQIPPPRGIIYDRNMRQLVWNKPSYDLICEKNDLPDSEDEQREAIETVAGILGLETEALYKKIKESESPSVLISEKKLLHQNIVMLETAINRLPGFFIQKNTARDYPYPMLSHVIGFTAKVTEKDLRANSNYAIADVIGRAGIEQEYENFLRGVPGKILAQKDVFGKKTGEETVFLPQPGDGLVLTIDYGLQEKIGEEMKKVLERLGVNSAAAVALSPITGEVLSLMSFPSFNNNFFSQGVSFEEWAEIQSDRSRPLFNRAISGIGYPSGSIIKPLIGLAALEEEIITENTDIYCPLEICVWNRYSKQDECFKDWEYHGTSDIKRAIAESVNTFFYIVGGGHKDFKGLGPEKIKEYLELFGWGEETGIDLPEEGKGVLPEINSNWRLGDTYHFSIGQGYFAITPIEVAVAFSAIANGGKLMAPHLLKSVVDSRAQLKTLKEIQPEIIKELSVSSENIRIIREGMRQTVVSGSATFLNDLFVKAAVKTGTAQSREGFYHHWITVFAPYEEPEIVLTLIIEDIEGAQPATLPVAKEALRWYFSDSR